MHTNGPDALPPASLASIRALILDIDGVLWRGSQPLGDLPDIFERIRRLGLHFMLVTNNATRSPAQVAAKLGSFGVEIEPSQVINSGLAAAYLLKKRFPEGGLVYAVGEEGLVEVLSSLGFTPVEEASPGVLAVVAGLDRAFTYAKLKAASALIRQGALFVGTNPDRTFPAPGGVVDPGAGAILAAIAAASGAAPVIAGKPEPGMYQAALDLLGTLPPETLVVGDRLETDMSGARVLGCRAALVLTGVTSPEEAAAAHPPPDLVARDLASVVDLLELHRI